MTDLDNTTTRTVRDQYEDMPYPPRDPEDERKRLLPTGLDRLAVMNHYCFCGRAEFLGDFRVLVAGGGTGDGAIWLGEQLKGGDASITYIDISKASMEVARKRAEVRGLENITWIHGSLLDVESMGLGKFDYINCSGVLHHLADPPQGLRALRGVLKDDGAIAIMVYGQYGRTGIYQMQDLMRLINTDQDDSQTKVANTHTILESAPSFNWFKRSEDMINDHKWDGDAGLYDLLLHSQDRAYTVVQLYELLETCDLNLAAFTMDYRAFYRPECWIRDETLLERVRQMPLPKQQGIAELLTGALKKHAFWACPQKDTMAGLDELENIPFLHGMSATSTPEQYAKLIKRDVWKFTAKNRPDLIIKPCKYARAFFKYIDGERSLAEILELAGADLSGHPPVGEIMAKAGPVIDVMREWGDFILLRHPSSRW